MITREEIVTLKSYATARADKEIPYITIKSEAVRELCDLALDALKTREFDATAFGVLAGHDTNAGAKQ